AEDGIRYRNVTGVQTCALPIYLHLSHHTVIFMFKIMAMEHVNTFLLKLYSYFHCLLRFYRNCVLPSLFIFRWFLSIPGEHFKLCSMNMEWMNHPTHVIR